jgi:hypothetical protein
MRTKLFILGLALALVAGCHTSSTRMNRISIGMSEEQVRNILGSPSSKSVNKDGSTTLYYTLNEAVIGEYPVPYSVHLTDDKVDFYGRDAGGAQMPRPIVTPIVH